MNMIARYRLKTAIQYHTIMRDNALYATHHGICVGSPSHDIYVKMQSDAAEREQRCINRIEKLLKRYK